MSRSKAITPMMEAAKRLRWRVTYLVQTPNNVQDLDELVRWCLRSLRREDWFFPLPGGRTASPATDFSQWGFATQALAESFAAQVRARVGEPGQVKVFEATGGRA